MKAEIDVTGVYATLHTNHGDVEANLTEVQVAGSLFTFHLAVQNAPFDGRAQSSTIHCGLLSKTFDLGDIRFSRGDTVTLIHPVAIGSMNNHES